MNYNAGYRGPGSRVWAVDVALKPDLIIDNRGYFRLAKACQMRGSVVLPETAMMTEPSNNYETMMDPGPLVIVKD